MSHVVLWSHSVSINQLVVSDVTSLTMFVSFAGKIWIPKPIERGPEEKIMLDLEDDSILALEQASDADLVDLAGILGLHSMLNQDQYNAAILNKGQQPATDKFESVVKSTPPKKLLPPEPDNQVNPEETAKQVADNDPNLTELNWNNIKYIPRDTFKRLFNGLKTNNTLTELKLSNTGLTDGPAEVTPREDCFLFDCNNTNCQLYLENRNSWRHCA